MVFELHKITSPAATRFWRSQIFGSTQTIPIKSTFALTLTYGPNPRSFRAGRQQNRRRRSGGASGFGREGTPGKRPGRRFHANQGAGRGRGKKADPDHR